MQPVVVGAGIIGASIAYQLAKAGAPPIILDDGPDGGRATAGSLAWINASWGNPLDYFKLRMRSIAEWHRLGREIAGLPLRFTGSVTYDVPLADLDRYAAQHADWGYRIRLGGHKDIATREPRLREMPEIAALCDDEGMVEPVVAAKLLREAAVRLGAAYKPGIRYERLELYNDKITGVVTTGGTIATHRVVIAAGVATPDLLSPLGIGLPLTSPEGLLVYTEPLPPVVNGLIVAPDFHVRQTAEGRLVSGFDFVGTIVGTPAKAAARLVRRLNEVLDLPEPARLSHRTLERRPTPADGFPAIGPLPQIGGLYVAVTHSGMTLAPAIGLLAAEEILTGKRDALLGPYAPTRFTP
ncbi:MAG: FAD-binding oxidoreductase [Hyphomicrobiaceae bacterium]